MKSSYTLPLAIIFGGIVVAGAVYISMPKSPKVEDGNPALVRPIGTSDHIFGNPAAKVVIVEYSDFDCDFCKEFDETMHQIIADEGATGKVAWIYREFPLIEIHPNAMQNAEAAECVAQVAGNDAFWDFKDQLFAHQPVNPTLYGTFAKAIGVPSEAFSSCFSAVPTTIIDRIKADRQNAFDIGAKGTPFSLLLVDGKPPVVMAGAYPYDVVKQLIDNALAN